MTIERADAPAPHPHHVTIEQVENGYLLTSGIDNEARFTRRDISAYEIRKPRVFPSKAALFAYLVEHFTHECTSMPKGPAKLSEQVKSTLWATYHGPQTLGSGE